MLQFLDVNLTAAKRTMRESSALHCDLRELTVYEAATCERGINQFRAPKVAADKHAVEESAASQYRFLKADIGEGAVLILGVLEFAPVNSDGTESVVRSLVWRFQLTKLSTC